MVTDLIMGSLGLCFGALLVARNFDLALLLKEGDDRYRDHPWLQAFEPTQGPLATDTGRITAFRAWFLVSGAAFMAVGAALLLRASL